MKQMNPALIALSLSLLCGRLPVAAQVGTLAPAGPARINNVPVINNGLVPNPGPSVNQLYHPQSEVGSIPAPTQTLAPAQTAQEPVVSPMPSRGQSTTINTNPNKVPRTTGTHNVKKHALGSARVGKVNDSSTTRSQQAQQIIEEGTKDWTKPEPDTVVGQTKKGASDLTKPTALIADLPGNQTPVPAVNAAAQRQKQIPLGEIMARLFAGFILLSGGALLVGIVGFIIQVGGANWGSVAFIGFIFSTIAILVGLKISFDGSRHHHHYHH